MNLGAELKIERCPYCSIANPNLFKREKAFATTDFNGQNRRFWGVFVCASCGGVVIASAKETFSAITEIYPNTFELEEEIPERVQYFLSQAIKSLSIPAGAVMLSASSVDAMLKNKGLINGSLFNRIDQAASQNIITPDMALWAHHIRLEANDQRHADETNEKVSEDDGRKAVEFAKTLAHILFVLPARVREGLRSAGASETSA